MPGSIRANVWKFPGIQLKGDPDPLISPSGRVSLVKVTLDHGPTLFVIYTGFFKMESTQNPVFLTLIDNEACQ